MAKKKKPQQQQPLSPQKYIRLKGRTLPIAKCYINENWQEAGMASIIVVRQHQSGNFTSAQYLVDTFCLGVKDTCYSFNFLSEELEEMLEHLPECTEITYNEAHNIIFGAITFAEEEAEILPHADFELTKYLLEEDTDDIPLIDYEFGRKGVPYLVTNTNLEASKYLPRLQKKFGEDFSYFIREEEEFDDYEEIDKEGQEEKEGIFDDLTPDQLKQMLQAMEKVKNNLKESAALTHTTYTYVHPPYPTTLELTHSELEVAVYNNEYYYALPRTVIQQLLALPRESLIADLDRIILYELGKSCDTITEDMYDQYPNTITHALFLLGELKATESLQTVLEILRQQDMCIDYYFGDFRIETLRPTVYYIARNQTDALLAFMKEPGLDRFARSYIPPVIATIAINEPERREEIISWFRKLLHFFITNVSDSSVYDASLSGSILSELIDIHAVELLPEIKELFDTEQVDCMCCGNYQAVEKRINGTTEPLSDYTLEDIYQRYQQYEKQWKR